jgi:hypothetical protein
MLIFWKTLSVVINHHRWGGIESASSPPAPPCVGFGGLMTDT